MKKDIQLYIKNQCHENWRKMDTRGDNKFCHSCSKTVFDLSRMNDVEIEKIIKQHKNGLCAQLRADQLDRKLILNTRDAYYKRFIPPLLSGVLSLTLPQMVQAQNTEIKRIEHFDSFGLPVCEEPMYDTIKTTNPIKSDSVFINRSIKGKVLDKETGEPMPFANIYIEDLYFGAVSDIEGNFNIEIPDSFQLDSINITVSMIGYKNLSWKKELNDSSILNLDIVKMQIVHCMILGGVGYSTAPQRIRKRIVFWVTWIPRQVLYRIRRDKYLD